MTKPIKAHFDQHIAPTFRDTFKWEEPEITALFGAFISGANFMVAVANGSGVAMFDCMKELQEYEQINTRMDS